MYLEHFGLQRHPFRMAPEDDFIYMSQQHSRAFVYMDSAVWSPEGFVVISGEIGSGKTTLLKKLMRGLNQDLKLFHIAYTNLKSDDLFHLIVRQAGLPYDDKNKVSMLLAINDYLQKLSDDGVPVVLAVDEAQNLSRENLEDIRMLSGLEGKGGPVMRVILLGQPELKDAIYNIPQLAQRVKLFFHLNGLSAKETGEYIDHRLFIAGYEGDTLFNADTVQQVYALSKGIPRLINKLCDGLMLCAYSDDRPHLNAADLVEIRQDLMGETFMAHMEAETGDEEKPSGTVDNSTAVADTPTVSEQASAPTDDTALGRIASALERIDAKLDRLVSQQDTPPSNVKPLNPKRRS
ncbi:ExeA family protein [Saccharospirillum alexandrii]|uniref:ExeA family protein n=1 Tax=Saccharospirillum alexandrii TaxID=2448477 RepID=UPI000FD93D38|nr:AAA family ATPase [Saccharospirillum alexandrii]